MTQHYPDEIWPGFQPDTIPILFVIPGEGSFLLNWTDALPQGYNYLDQEEEIAFVPTTDPGAASTTTVLGGRKTAQVVLKGKINIYSTALSLHESFHVFQKMMRTEGKRFGQQENSFLVTQYPIFDINNESEMALEGRLLLGAIQNESNAASKDLAAQFLAVREARQRSLSAELVEFEQTGEMNEGLAEYVGLKGLELLSKDASFPQQKEAAEALKKALGQLNDLTKNESLSIRLRFYISGPGIAFLMDDLRGKGWKAGLMNQNLSLQDMLAEIIDYRKEEKRLKEKASQRYKANDLQSEAQERIQQLSALRQRQIDSMLAVAGVPIMIDASNKGFIDMCSIDPQNLLQAGQHVLLHNRWLKPCIGGSLNAAFNTPVVQHKTALWLKMVLGQKNDLQIEVEGQPISIESIEGLQIVESLKISDATSTLATGRARLEKNQNGIRITLLLL